jgi:hypothetical protein
MPHHPYVPISSACCARRYRRSLDPRRVVRDAYNVAGEKRAAVGGAAGGGLLLFVVFV